MQTSHERARTSELPDPASFSLDTGAQTYGERAERLRRRLMAKNPGVDFQAAWSAFAARLPELYQLWKFEEKQGTPEDARAAHILSERAEALDPSVRAQRLHEERVHARLMTERGRMTREQVEYRVQLEERVEDLSFFIGYDFLLAERDGVKVADRAERLRLTLLWKRGQLPNGCTVTYQGVPLEPSRVGLEGRGTNFERDCNRLGIRIT